MPEQLLIDHCAPTLAGLKTANMFQAKVEEGQDICSELKSLNRLLGRKGLRIVLLRRTEKMALIYVYRPDCLGRDLNCWIIKKRIREAKRRHCFRMPHNRMGQIIKQGVRYI